MNPLVNRNVIVIGGIFAIELATARQLAAEGARVTAVSRAAEIATVKSEAAELAVEEIDATLAEALQAFFERHAPFDDPTPSLSRLNSIAAPAKTLLRCKCHNSL